MFSGSINQSSNSLLGFRTEVNGNQGVLKDVDPAVVSDFSGVLFANFDMLAYSGDSERAGYIGKTFDQLVHSVPQAEEQTPPSRSESQNSPYQGNNIGRERASVSQQEVPRSQPETVQRPVSEPRPLSTSTVSDKPGTAPAVSMPGGENLKSFTPPIQNKGAAVEPHPLSSTPFPQSFEENDEIVMSLLKKEYGLTGLEGTRTQEEISLFPQMKSFQEGTVLSAQMSEQAASEASRAARWAGAEPNHSPSAREEGIVKVAALEGKNPVKFARPEITVARGARMQPEPAQVADQIVRRARFKSTEGVHRAQVTLHPKSLGRVDMEIIIEKQSVKAYLIVEHDRTRVLLEQGLDLLKEGFAKQGLEVDEFTVMVGQERESFRNALFPDSPSQGGNKQGEQPDKSSAVEDDNASRMSLSSSNRTIDIMV